MRIYYHLSNYISHRKAGMDYITCLKKLGHEVFMRAEDAGKAEVAIIHDDALCLAPTLKNIPELKGKPIVAYCVWENEELPAAYIQNLALVDEIWTCSSFVQKAMQKHFEKVHILPHVVKKTNFSEQDMAYIKKLIGFNPEHFFFFSICDAVNPRKNITALLSAFQFVRKHSKRHVWLVLKQHRFFMDFSNIKGVISVNDKLTDGQIGALHFVCDAYASTHHAEGWGLGLSESMSFGKPVIATGYSGNMDYMNYENSLPQPYKLVPISEQMQKLIPLFTTNMRWAEVDTLQMAKSMLKVVEGGVPLAMSSQAQAITKDFGTAKICLRLAELLQNMIK